MDHRMSDMIANLAPDSGRHSFVTNTSATYTSAASVAGLKAA